MTMIASSSSSSPLFIIARIFSLSWEALFLSLSLIISRSILSGFVFLDSSSSQGFGDSGPPQLTPALERGQIGFLPGTAHGGHRGTEHYRAERIITASEGRTHFCGDYQWDCSGFAVEVGVFVGNGFRPGRSDPRRKFRVVNHTLKKQAKKEKQRRRNRILPGQINYPFSWSASAAVVKTGDGEVMPESWSWVCSRGWHWWPHRRFRNHNKEIKSFSPFLNQVQSLHTLLLWWERVCVWWVEGVGRWKWNLIHCPLWTSFHWKESSYRGRGSVVYIAIQSSIRLKVTTSASDGKLIKSEVRLVNVVRKGERGEKKRVFVVM